MTTVEEIMKRLPPCKPNVRERVRRLNAKGVPGGCMIRGWHRKNGPNSGLWDTCGRKEFEAKWGKGTYGRLPKWMLIKIGGKRRAVPGTLYMQGPPWLEKAARK